MKISEREMKGILVLDVKGKMTLGDENDLGVRVKTLLAREQKSIVVNMKAVPYIDGAGLGDIVRSYTSVVRAGGTIKFSGVNRQVKREFRITKLTTVFELYPNVRAALASF